MGDDADMIPVRENSMYPTHKNHNVEDQELFAQRAAQQRQMVTRWSRDDLEDKYLRQYEENLVLKKHVHKQEDKIKRMATKLLRLVSDKKKNEKENGVKKVRDIETEEMLEELHGKIRDLEKQNNMLREKLMVAKQQLGTQSKRSTLYGHVQSRINTGIPKAPPDPRITRNIRVMGPPPSTNRANQSPTLPRYGHSLLEDARAENQHLEGVIDQLNEQINIYEQDVELLKEQMRVREAEYEEDLLRIKQQMTEGQRSAIQENIDIIRLQREVKEKATKMAQLEGQYRNLEDKLRSVKGSHDQVLHEMGLLNHQLKDEQNRNLSLHNEIKSGSSNQRRLVELQERITDLERECDILKEANEKLVNSAFDLEREREWRQRENALKVQIAQLEATLKSDVGEKGNILDKLTEERDAHDNLEEEHKQMRISYFQLKHEHEELQEKLRFFTQESAVDFQEIEEALMIVKQRREKNTQDLDFLSKVDDEKGKDYEKLIRELQAEHADTINELEKTRNLLIVQHKINKDYQMETEAVTKKMEENKSEYETKLEEYAQLLDIRAARIRKLEAQLRDVAYGTRQYRIQGGEEEEESSDVDEMDETIHLERGENLFEIHIKRVIITQEGLKEMGDEEPALFCTWEFYEHEIQATPVLKGPKPEFRFTSQYLVKMDDFFLHYLQKDSTTLELHQSFGTDYHTVAACQLSMRDILERSHGRLHGTVYLAGVGNGKAGVQYGSVEYWVRLRVPMEQALRLYKERTKALGYINTNIRHTEQALEAMDEAAAQRPPDNINQLHIKVVCCKSIHSRRQDVQPSPYVIYKFFDYDDHDTTIIMGSNNPQFNDHKTFPVPVTAELDKYLKSQPLVIYVFDDTDPEQTEYLGMAKVPLISLAHDKGIKGIFELKRKDGQVNGTVEVSLKWQYTYIPPRAGTTTPAQAQILASAGQPSSESLPLLPGEEDQLQQSSVVAGAPGTFPQTPSRVPRPPAPRGPGAASTPTPAVRMLPTQSQVEVTVTPPTPTSRRLSASTGQYVGFSSDLASSTIVEEGEDSIVSEGSHVTGESLPVSVSESLASTPRGPPDEEIAPLPSPRSRKEGGSAEEREMAKAQGLLLKAAIARRNNRPPPVTSGPAVPLADNEKMTSSQESVQDDSIWQDEETKKNIGLAGRPVPFPRRTLSLLPSYHSSQDFSTGPFIPGVRPFYPGRDKNKSKKIPKRDEEKTPEELIAEELGQTGPDPISEDTMFGDEEVEEEEIEEEEIEEEESEEEEKPHPTTDFDPVGPDTLNSALTTGEEDSDSEGLVVARSPHPRPPSINTASGNPDVVIVTISSLALHENSRPMEDDSIKMLFVEYRLLGVPMDETETPFSLPKPKPYESISFNFRKVFHVDFAKNYERRQYLASMLLPDDPDEGRIRITMVNEPLEDEEDQDCHDVGVAFVSVRSILSNDRDLVDEDIPIYDIEDESTEIGTMKVTVECLAALHAVQQEMKTTVEN